MREPHVCRYDQTDHPRFFAAAAILAAACGLALAGVLVGDLLLQLAGKVALANHFAGLAMLTLVALAQLVVTVAMFHVLRPGLPHVLATQRSADKAARSATGMVTVPSR